MKMTSDRPFDHPEKAVQRLTRHARAFDPYRMTAIYIEKINAPFLFGDRATAAKNHAGHAYAVELGWIELHESGTYVRFTQSGDDQLA